MDHAGRLRRLKQALGQNQLDALLVTHLPNVRYLCGFTGSTAALLVSDAQAVLFTDGRYTSQAHQEVAGARVSISQQGAVTAAADWLNQHRERSRARRPRILGIEADFMTVAARQRLGRALNPGLRVRPAPPLVQRARMVKDAGEIRSIRAAAKLGCSLFHVALSTIAPGVPESEVAAAMEFAARRAGASEMSFSTIVAGGKRSALPHGRASRERIPRQGFVVCDFGVILAGYCSDMTRTVWVGHAGSAAVEAYQSVLEAQLAAVVAVRPGVTAAEVDHAARSVLKKARLAKYFMHSTGHGVGLEIHEPPRLAAGQNEPLQAGMVITIEPGVYLPGKWGIRIEDMVLVTERGGEVLTPTGKELITVSEA
jgi:Xaa-Pro aminopeptidase